MDNSQIESLILKWNPHFQDLTRPKWAGTIPREKYLQPITKAMDLRHIIVLTGVRRSGKSTLLQQAIGKLIENRVPPKNTLYLFLEDVVIAEYLSLGSQFLEKLFTFYLEKYSPEGRIYVFLDEIQGIADFNRWLNTHYELGKNIKFIVSGSHKSLLESQMATLLTGRTVQFVMYPFNFYEYLLVHKVPLKGGEDLAALRDANFDLISKILHHLGNYLNEGGFPEIVLTADKENKQLIANAYYRDILARDIIIPNAIRNPKDIEILGVQILSDFTKTHTYRSLGYPRRLSVETVKTYLENFYKAYLFFESQFFSYKTKETQDIQRPRKIYVVDNGIRNFNTIPARIDLGRCAENTVFMELKRNNVAAGYWQGKKEVDFVVQNEELNLINISYTDELNAREIEGMVEGLEEFNLEKGTVLTKNTLETKKAGKKKIELVPLWAWLIQSGKTFFKE